MKVVILTSNIIDGLVISERIIKSGKDVKAVFYEEKKVTPKNKAKRILFKLTGKMGVTRFNDIPKGHGKIDIKKVGDMNSDDTRETLKGISPDLIVVIGTGKLKSDIYRIASKGAINMHSGILPYYRGADSEFWALSNGEPERIGVTIHFISDELDAGDIILTAPQKVEKRDDYKSLRMKNIFLGADKMVEAISMIESGRYVRTPQDESLAKTYRSATKEQKDNYRKER